MVAPRIYVDGKPEPYERGSLSYDRSVVERSPAKFTLLDLDVTDHLQRLTAVRIHRGDDGALDWSGFLQTAAESRIGKAASLRVKCAATDPAGLMDSRLAAAEYTLESASSILLGLVDEFGAAEGIRCHDYDRIVADDGAVHHWKLAEDVNTVPAADQIGGAAGTYVNSPTPLVEGAVIGPETAVAFDQSGDAQAVVATFPDFGGTASGHSIEAWLRPDRDGSNDYAVRFGSGVPIFTLNRSGGAWRVFHRDNADDLQVVGGSATPNGEWVHVVGVYDASSGDLTIYEDGVQTGQIAAGAGRTTTLDSLDVAQASPGASTYEGAVQHVAAYDVALTATQVQHHYDAGTSGFTTGVPTPTINTTNDPVVEVFVANYEPLAETVDRLAELIGWDWYVDPRRVIHFHPRGSANAPFTIDTTVVLDDVEVSRKNTRYRNRQVVRGGIDVTSTQTERFVGDGERQTFTVSYAMAEEPSVTLDPDGAATAQTVGIRGVDDPDAFDWYWQKGDANLSQQSSATPLSTSQRIAVSYVGQYPFVAIVDAIAEQDRIAGIGHGTGRVEDVADVPESVGRDAAIQYADGRLDRWAQDHRIVKFSTRQPGLAAGQVAIVNLPLHGMDTVEVLLENVSAKLQRDVITYSCDGTEGPIEGSWTEFFDRIARRGRGFIERTNEGSVVLLTARSSADWMLTTSETETVTTCPILPFDVPQTLC